MQSTYPEVPDLGRLRLARITDVPRMATVATASFYHSPAFAWERPRHKAHPRSTWLSYANIFADAIRDPEEVVVVAMDKGDPEEDDHTGATIVRGGDDAVPAKDQDVIVGIFTLGLKSDTARHGQFMDRGDEKSHNKLYSQAGDDNDKDMWAVFVLYSMINAKSAKLFQGQIMIETLCVHPAYGRRGHASALLQWGMKLADIDQKAIGVDAVATGEPLYQKLGFRKIEGITLQNPMDHTKEVYTEFWKRAPSENSS